ncbi:hypothetical protein TCAL_14275 [Tigriopus californicus]|uniref:Uncharacterized protein n=1 Tax=Tigriopus californicus TaxID=6832 RepID=A0A553NT26_TIGCA|nr:hypothetical protein TCAL_14275 [Tigriopus californicus]
MSSDWETQELKLRRKNADLDRQRASVISDRGTTSDYPSISDITRSKIPIKVELRAKKPQGPHAHTEGPDSQNLYAQCMVQLKTRNEENAKLRKELDDCRKELRNLSSNQVETHKTAQVLQDQALKLASNEIIELKRENQVLQKDLQVAKDADLKSKSHIEKISLEVRRLSAVNQDLEYQLKVSGSS